MRIIIRNLIDEAELTASPDCVATLPVTNLQTVYREQLARWTELDAQQFTAIWDGASPVSCVVMYRNNFGPNATWRVRLYEDGALTEPPLYDSGSVVTSAPTEFGNLVWGVDPLGQTLYTDWDYGVASLWFDAVLAQALVININDPENPDGYGQATRLFAGEYFEPQHGVSVGLGIVWDENTRQTRTEGGSLRTEPGSSWRTMDVKFQAMPEGDRRVVLEMLRRCGMRQDLFVSAYPDRADELERDYQMQAKLINIPPLTTNYPEWHDQALTFGEV